MFVIGPHGKWHVQVGEYWQGAVWLGNHGSTLDILVRPETDIDGRLARCSEQLCSRVLVKHSFAECSKFLPLKAAVLAWKVGCYNKLGVQQDLGTHDELFAPHGCGEVSVERDPEVLGIVTLLCHNVFQKRGLMTEDLSQSSASSE